jgi:hypothetical protein
MYTVFDDKMEVERDFEARAGQGRAGEDPWKFTSGPGPVENYFALPLAWLVLTTV